MSAWDRESRGFGEGVRGNLSGVFGPLVRYEPCPLIPVYYAIPYLGLYYEQTKRGLTTHEMIKERVIYDTDNGTALIDEPQRYADEWESVDKVCGSICLLLIRF